jgi:hypothetical protein
MIHHRERLPLRVEARQNALGVHAGLDELERDLPLDRLGLLGEVNRAHATFADHIDELVSPG